MEISEHAHERFVERLQTMIKEKDITVEEGQNILNNLDKMLNYDFDCDRSFGVLLGEFKINPESKLVTTKHNSGIYYEINSLDYDDVVRDSTGNEFWGIIRNGVLVTMFLRKTVQRKTAKMPRKEGGLGVNVIIINTNHYF